MWILFVILAVIGVVVIAAIAFVHQPSFGQLPRGARLERIERSSHYRDGKFQNLSPTPTFTGDARGLVSGIGEFLNRKQDGLVPTRPIAAIETDLRALDPSKDQLIWFGHSSFLLQVEGKRLLVDPVFDAAAPLAFINRPFPGTDIYAAEDMPEDIDVLLISHDHWDHLDHDTVVKLMGRVKRVVCGLGVGAHFEHWGYPEAKIVELDWNERVELGDGFTIHALPARHFSGRGLSSGKSLWASFLVQAPSQKIYVSGDGGYDAHFADIGQRFGDIDLVILENGQYNKDWKYIHLMPEHLGRAARELNAKALLTVHHSKYLLSTHPWDEPLKNAADVAREEKSLRVLMPTIGEPVGWR
ncbi:MAG: MBL fold metallo-hydrolase [Myxococcales bacterium]|jgi:L-ascorbate metabolism protein UlaG (beta-lactamase superfamily)|nr:MBL fold metallo-hydrolase [Myxococcales bacterium]